MARVFLEAYGCSASFADSEMIAGIISNGGHVIVDSPSESDLNVIVTCSVKDATANRMIHRIKSLQSRPLVVAGCFPKAEKHTVEKFAKNASMMGPNSLGNTLQVVKSTLDGKKLISLDDTDTSKTGLPKVRLNPAVGIIEIASGCLSECTFCQTKLAKGDITSYRIGDIVRQVNEEVNDGCKEIWLTSTDNGCYGLDIGTNLPELISTVREIPGEFMIRIGMMNPMYLPKLKDRLVESYDHPRIYKFLHIPVQSGSDKVLHDMKRGHTSRTFSEIVRKTRARFGHYTISTDIIVGFPSETIQDFEKTMELIKETRPDIINLSRYSARPGTEAATWKQIEPSEIKRRSKIIFEMAKDISLENNKKWIGWHGRVLFVEKTDEGVKGRNFAYKPVFVGEDVKIGQACMVRIERVTANCLIGSITS